MAKISNILYMIDLLNTGNVYTIKDLSEKIGVTERKIIYMDYVITVHIVGKIMNGKN